MRAVDNIGEVHDFGDQRRCDACRHDATAACGYCGPRRKTTGSVTCTWCQETLRKVLEALPDEEA